ncbi:MAG: conjugal transfer protein TraO [Bacteroidota bacterium]|nr:conjugal transfer protein TraO [Bacteroidota bacterium]MDP4268512.1 conjugal transfer protein TraO [Bacteroidota bacterium]
MQRTALIMAVIISLTVSSQAWGQRHLPSQKGIQLTAGLVDGLNLNTQSDGFGFHSGLALTSYTKGGNHWLLGGEYLQKQHTYGLMHIPQAQFTGEAGYFLNVLSDNSKTLFCSVGLSALAGFETINWDKKLLADGALIQNKDAFIYGGTLTFESEFFTTDYLSLLFNVRERMLTGSTVGKFHTQIGMGIRLYY